MLVALVAGALLGFAGHEGGGWLVATIAWFEPLGALFVRLVTMVLVPLVVASLFVSLASLDGAGRLGRIGGVTVVYFAVTTCAAAVIGVLVAVLFNVGGHGGAGALLPAGAPAGLPAP